MAEKHLTAVPSRAALYVRVSTTRQDDGFSPEAQVRTATEYCDANGFRVVETVKDVDWSGGWSVRPGLDELRDLAEARKIDVVVVAVRDRWARGLLAQVLKEEFEELGVRVVALDSRGDDSPEGQLADGVMDLFSGYEKKRVVRRMFGGKLERARKGQVVATRVPKYGYRNSEDRKTYVVDEEKMAVVRRIFRMIGVEGMTLRSTRKALETEGTPSPSGRPRWVERTIKEIVQNDVYRPHYSKDIAELVTARQMSPEVFADLDPEQPYGVWWFNTRKNVTRPDVEVGPGGRREYRKRRVTTKKPEKDHIAVLVPDAGVPLEWVEAARVYLGSNRFPNSNSPKVFELSGGMLRCERCGMVLQVYHRKERRRKTQPDYFYYRCSTKVREGKDACGVPPSYRREDLDGMAWTFVKTLLSNPELLKKGLDEMVRQEEKLLRGDPAGEARRWLKKAEACEKESGLLLDLYLKGKIDEAAFDAKRIEIEERKDHAMVEAAKSKSRTSRLASLMEARETLVEKYAATTSERLKNLSPEGRQRIYRMMGLRATVDEGPTLLLGGRLIEAIGEEGRTTLENATEIALESGYLKSAGRTPQNTMRARLSVDVRDNPETPFAQTAPGVYRLREPN
ncbi:hypothetical protein GBA63_09205 [Rubrobacter tropicus]|uniref:Recombinase family protein n=1 Tax=Rubrobacter tropicus TaxID=2653851 RepID=A0A6G8Q8N4_9ACTN|nr:recombinase family protein [Rubrobacter tropicus]QIN82809.1 hypothetical protein GBA63_09205 [Rubrobacter tropicus]